MNIDDALRDAMLVKGIQAKVYEDVYALLEREVARSKDCGDRSTAEYTEILIAKIKGLEAGRYMGQQGHD